jgi:hypothetical protein
MRWTIHTERSQKIKMKDYEDIGTNGRKILKWLSMVDKLSEGCGLDSRANVMLSYYSVALVRTI